MGIRAKVYAYCEVGSTPIPTADAYPRHDLSIHGRPVYVGQTIQELKERDSQHLASSLSTFDRDYTSRSQYIMVLLSERHFAAAEKEEDFKEETLHPAGEWMDYCETTYISTFDTFHTGLNRTKGGQGRGWLVAMSEAIAKATYLRFLTVYMPAFRKYYEDHKEDRHANAPYSHPILGRLISSIRSGLTRIPPQFEEELLTDMGLDLRDQTIVERDRKWGEEYMPAFRTYYEDHKETRHANAPYSHPILGSLIDHIRSGDTRIPPQFEEELLTGMGLDLRDQTIVERDRKWEEKYMPAFRKYYEDHKEDRHANAPQTHTILGSLISSIRSGLTRMPPQFEEELLTDMGLDLRDQKIVERDRRWEEEYMPAFRKYYEDHKETRHANAPGTHPILGKLISNIRSANTRIPPHFEEEMRRMQLLLCYENLARHVMRTLHRTVGCIETDVEAKQVLEEATKMHALLSSLRAGIKGRPALLKAGLFQLPFGKTPLGDGVARFVADMKCLDKERSATRKRKRS